jgi:hypothetical protein
LREVILLELARVDGEGVDRELITESGSDP